jgi:hypothetical protein
MAEAFLIRTPTDFERAMASDAGDYVKAPLVTPRPELEEDLRHALDGIFNDLQYVDRGDGELFASYLDGIKGPLDDLHRLGLTLFALVTHGSLTLGDHFTLGAPKQRTIPNWSRTYYLVVPENGFFRIGEDVDGTVHRFSPNCTTAIAALADASEKQTGITVWFKADRVRVSLEGDVPWCQQCCLDESMKS